MQYVVLRNDLAAGIVRRVKRQEATIEGLRTRLAERDALLSRALQELAVFRLEKDPDWFVYQRNHRHRSHPGFTPPSKKNGQSKTGRPTPSQGAV